MKLKGKVAVVTGSNRGIRLAIANEMLKEGAKVVITSKDLVACQRTCKKLERKYKNKTLPIQCDVSKGQEVGQLMKEVVKKFKHIDILVNNAGIVHFGSLLKKTEQEWDKTIDVNLKGVFLCTKEAAKYMTKQKKGKIISISSIAGIVGFEGIPEYCASKGGIVTITKEMALELAPYNINVNAIAPGVIKTKMTEGMLKDKKTKAGLLKNTPLGRIGNPEDIGKAAVFLASDDASFITGHNLVVDGGWISK